MSNENNNPPIFGAKIAMHVPGHEESTSDVISSLIRRYINEESTSLYNITAGKVLDIGDEISSVSISNIPSPPISPADFPAGDYEENPTSVVNRTSGNYRHIYEVVQTSGRSLNNRWFVKNQGFSISKLISIPSTTVLGHYDFIMPDHTEHGKSKHVFVERFSAPGSSYTMPLGMLDVEAEEFSSYNSLNFRNLDVRRHLTNWLTEHYSIGEISYEDLADISIFIPKTIINSGAFHKTIKNTTYVPQIVTTESSGGTSDAGVSSHTTSHETTTTEYKKRHDNFWKQGQIPARGHQYHWINSSIQDTGELQGFASNYSNVSAQYPAIDTNPSSENYGKAVGVKPKTGKTTFSDGHTHTYTVDASGNGTSSFAAGHYHEITNWKLAKICKGQEEVCSITDCSFSLGTPSCECIEAATSSISSFGLENADPASYHCVISDCGFDVADPYCTSDCLPETSSGVVTLFTDCHLHTIQAPKEDGFAFLNLFKTLGSSPQEQIRIIDKNSKEVFFEPNSSTLEGNYILGDDIFSDDIWKKYEDGTTTLNELLLNRSGPYPYPSWKQIRNVDNPMVIEQRKRNILSVANVLDATNIAEKDTATNYIEPAVTWNKAMSHKVSFSSGNDALLVHSYSNNIEIFTNNALKERVKFTKDTNQMYDLIKKEYGGTIELKNAEYKEQIFPRKSNIASLKTRSRINYKEVAGFGSDGYDKRSTEIRTFWKDIPLERRRTPYDAGDYTIAGRNAFDISVRNSSTWALDYHKHKSRIGVSSLDDDHTHTYEIDKNGNGITSTDDGHSHVIKGWKMLNFCDCEIADCDFNLSDVYCEGDCEENTTTGALNSTVITSCHAHTLQDETVMRGDLAWAGYAQTRGYIYNSTEPETIDEQQQGGSSIKETNAWADPRPALQYIHNPNTMKAKEDGWPWDAGKSAKNTPWQDSYIKYNTDVKLHGKDYSLLPEYRISKHMDFYINDSKGNFKVKVNDEDIMEIRGINENISSATLDYYSTTDDIKHIEKISTDHKEETQMLRLEIDAIIKLLPYNGFYPSQRSVQLGGLFYDSVIPHVTGTKDNVDSERARTAQAALQPYFAPGILFNSIKSGIAVDWAAYAGKYDGGNEEISMRDKFLGRSFVSKSGMNTEAGKAVMKRAMAAWTRDVKLGKVDKSDYDDKKKGFNSYYCAALNSAGKQYNRLFNIVSQQCNTRDFIDWCNSRGLEPNSAEAQNNFKQNVCGDSKWNYNPALTSDLYKVNVESLLGKDIIPSSNNNPNNVKMIVSTILSELQNLPEQAPDLAGDTTISERDLEGAYMDFAPNKRIPFEGLVSISKGLSNLDEDQAKIFYAAPSYYLERFEIGSSTFESLKHCDTEQDLYNNLRYPYFEWSGDSTALYELAMHNFLAEVPNFFMKNKKFTTFESAPENKFEDAEIGKTYYMDVSLYKQGNFDMTLSPFDGAIAKVEQSASAAEDELVDLSGNSYTTQGRYFGPALRYKPLSTSNKDNFYIGDPAQAAYTPPYFYGKAIARLSYKATKTNPSLNDILSNIKTEYINTDLDAKFASHSPNNTYVNTPAYKGRMPLESSINIKGRTKKDIATTDGSEVSSWTISPRFESPVLNFNTEANKEIIKESAEAGKPRGIGMWSGYGEIPKGRDGVYFELLDSFAPEEELSSSDETQYIISIGIPSDVRSIHNNTIQLFEPAKDSDIATDEIKIGQPSNAGEQIFPETTIDNLQAEFFGLSKDTQFYYQDSRIRTIYTSQHATKNNPRIGMEEYDIEAYLESTTSTNDPASNLVPRPFDVANAICYHINYNNQADENYNWRASVKWVSGEHTSNIVGASLDALSDKDPAYKDNNLTGFGAVVEIEWIRPQGNFTSDDVPKVKLDKSSEKLGLQCLKPANSRYKPDFKIGVADSLEFYPRITSSESKKTVSNYGSLIDLCGFSRNEIKSRIGELATEKDISEAVVMIPFVEGSISDIKYATTIEVEGKNFFKISDAAYETAAGDSISSMKDNMQKYNLPAHYDFAKYSSISPFVMYIFEFTEKLDQDDLSNIWQGLMPNIARRSTKFNDDLADKYSNKQVIEHELNGDNFFEGKKLPPTTNPLKWITFKVKRKANIDYYKVTSDTTDDKNFKITTSEGESLKPDYSYNWPYDYFSLIELAKIDGGITIVPKKKEEDEE